MKLRIFTNRVLIGIAVIFLMLGLSFFYIIWSGEGTRPLKQEKLYVENVVETFEETLSKEELKLAKKEIRIFTVKIFFLHVLSIVILIGSIGTLVFVIAFTKRCPKCKKYSAFSKAEKRLYGNPKEIWMKVENEERSEYSGEVIARHEQYITGSRETYQTIYRCKYCGYEGYTYKTVDIPNT